MRAPRQASAPLGALVLAAAIVLGALVLSLAPLVGWERQQVIAPALPARSALTAAASVALVLALVALAVRRTRAAALPLVVALALAVGLHAPVLVSHGLSTDPVAAPGPGQLRVLSWNTNGALVTPDVIARLAADQDADVVVLPQRALKDPKDRYRTAFADAGHPMERASTPGYRIQTAVWLTPDLAPLYRYRSGPDPWKSVALLPADPDAQVDGAPLPTIVALHAPWPVGPTLSGWKRDIAWVTELCSTEVPVVVAGDFNASIDVFGGPSLGRCVDAAHQRDGAAVGSWPTWAPPVLSMPIDHVLSTPEAGRVVSFSVLRSEDDSGTRHRPVMAVVQRGR
ncbi:Uncharacterized conserved protein YafD, endonuclease/exonuclease/phosphatase (EEP) superfamily [Quadrisphaera granulorum]|uniref:Endonuclease/exonuclease/phosphatase (EEP) superfamily protein YafD n=1 Tax=Quadrisphaera granulorum TaxID=317664 RepID=A0A316AC19_9ACTN|nr:endonuclease/exonuclease/phosphatase family protein [Quadrisphaera granulorum]PWJ55132.1 endonuclease/exonuclease/phosphatase (EEP) superfamily protein YafD [Quadrisphaera granulorum]SZE95641.1 Uncharacterized conserved protein YafD, endonuclease/exonuclease/phosphatase (EEP) superfamily [Quadrisphaera granulorum]